MKFPQSLKQYNITLFVSRLFFAAIVLLISIGNLKAQATLSVQGIVKKSNGVALEDGEYPITFKLYVVDSTQVKWSETIPNVELISGIYSVVLGQITPLTLAFNKDYELGVSIGTQEMLPRIKLTSAPYALSLRGQTNQFPSTGLVLADRIKVDQGIVVAKGAPIVNNTDGSKGLSFINDNDSGVFSSVDGEVSVYTNGVKRMEVTPVGSTINGVLTATTVGANNINLYNNGNISYSTTTNGTLNGWRLADIDDQTTGADGWQSYNEIPGSFWGWQNPNPNSAPCTCFYGANSSFIVNVLEPQNNNQVLKKLFSPDGTYNQVKVVFRYYFIDGWDYDTDLAYAGFANDSGGSGFDVAWKQRSQFLSSWAELNNAVINFAGQSNVPDSYVTVEMLATRSTPFWVFAGANLNESTFDEHFAISNIEVWVR